MKCQVLFGKNFNYCQVFIIYKLSSFLYNRIKGGDGMNRMRELRKKADLTMKQLGRIVGVSESTISLYERGQHEPDFVTLSRIAECLNTSVDYLLERDDTPDTKKEPAASDGLDKRLVEMLVSLSPDQVQRVQDFVAGLKASDPV